MPSKKLGKTTLKTDPRLVPIGTRRTARISKATLTHEALRIWLNDGRTISTPLSWYPTLKNANPKDRRNFRAIGAGYGLEWENLDFHLDVAGMMAGKKERARRVATLG
jgi:Protein of unknown function (DUF2442)